MILRKVFLCFVLVFLPVSFTFADTFVFANPLWGDIDQENPPNSVSSPASTQIASAWGQELSTAYYFCNAFGYSLSSYLASGNINGSVAYVNDEWVDYNYSWDLLEVVCEDGVSSGGSGTSTIPDIIVNLGDFPDYTPFYKMFMLIFLSAIFALYVLLFSDLVKKFTS